MSPARAWERLGWLGAGRRLVKGPLTVTDGGPVRPRQLGKTECQGRAINTLAADWARSVKPGAGQAAENVQFRQDGVFGFSKHVLPSTKIGTWGSHRAGAQGLARELMKSLVGGRGGRGSP